MATSSSFQLLPSPKPFLSVPRCKPKPHFLTIPIPHCTASPDQTPDPEGLETPPSATSTTSFVVTKRVPSTISPERRRRAGLTKEEPPNFEIGWKRTKEIKNEKPRGWVIADFLEKLEGLMGRGNYGSAQLLGITTSIVAERAREEAEVLREEGSVEERVLTELNRVVRLVEMDVEMVKAAVKEETRKERVETARARCRQAILVALSL